MNENLVNIRHYLHQNPELSGDESNTIDFIRRKLKNFAADKIIQIDNCNGIIAIFNNHITQPSICFRADIDALPITENNKIPYASKESKVAHKCGHDGHTTILLGLAHWLKSNKEKISSKIILLFQPEEETGNGALKILKDNSLNSLYPDFMFGFHNLPGFPLRSVILKKDIFASASCGLIITLTGKTAHAGEPENGINPLPALLRLIQSLNSIPNEINANTETQSLITIIYLKLGEKAFGTAPGSAQLMATLRSNGDNVLQSMKNRAQDITQTISSEFNVKSSIQWTEEFAATINDSQAYQIVQTTAEKSNLTIINPDKPFSWSEDFSYYGINFKTCFFGLGAGEQLPQLHNPDYDFPDKLLPIAIDFLIQLIGSVENIN